MAWINPALLLGLGLVAAPIILHMMLRARPKPFVFPALRLIEQTRRHNSRRLQLRHLWLLLARMAVLALIVLAVARPTLPAAQYRPTLYEGLMLAVIAGLAILGVWGWEHRQAARTVGSQGGGSSGTRPKPPRSTRPRWGAAVVAIALALLLVGLPYQQRIAAAWSDPVTPVTDEMPVAAVFIFDTSSSMGYVQAGESRLEAARRLAKRQVAAFPPGSRVAVDDTAAVEPPLFAADPAATESRMSQLEVRDRSGKVPSRIREALRLHRDDRQSVMNDVATGGDDARDRFVREIYVFSDLAISSWDISRFRELKAAAEEQEQVGIYVMDVGIAAPTNASLSGLSLSAVQVPANQPVTIEATVGRIGNVPDTQGVELILRTADGTARKQAGKSVELTNAGTTVSFRVDQVTPPYLQGAIRLVGGDPLAVDDELHFTVGIRERPEVVVVSDRREEAVLWMEALAPAELRQSDNLRYAVRYVPPNDVTADLLESAAAVCLIHVRQPSEPLWQTLDKFVRDGGGLFVSLGTHDLSPVAYQTDTARSLLPATPLAYLIFRPSETLAPTSWEHPVLRAFDRMQATGELTAIPFLRYWRVEQQASGEVVSPFNNDRRDAAVLSRAVGDGRVLLFASAVDGSDWNDLPFSWAFVAFADQILQFLTQQDRTEFNFTIDETVMLPVGTPTFSGSGLLRTPDFKQLRIPEGNEAGTYLARRTDVVGSYQYTPSAEPNRTIAAFSVNPDPDESDLTPITSDDLNELIGEKRYSLANDLDALERQVSAGRLGQEMYALLMFVLAAGFAAELLLANRFYSSESIGQMESVASPPAIAESVAATR